MKADAKGFKFLSMEGKVKIPFFQRTYVWTEENWEELLAELLNESKETNFLGAIILKPILSRSGEPKQLEVIDGQQRLTTLSILLKALYDTLLNEYKSHYKEDIMNILQFKNYNRMPPQYEIRIEPSHVDSEAYKQVMGNTVDLEKVNENSHPLLRCYKYFVESSRKMDDSKRGNLLNKILNPENKMLVVIDLDDKDDEQAIFDTLNTAGVKLTAAEIVKNAIFKRAIELKDKDSAIKLYEETWQETFLKDEETVKYWETERTTGRLKRDNIEILLHCVGVIKGFYDPDKHTLHDLSKLYKDQLKNINSFYELKDFMDEIIQYAKIYREKIITFDKSVSFSFDDSITRLLHILEELEISTFHPFLLFIFKKYQSKNDDQNKNDKKIIESLEKLEKFVIRNMLAKIESVKNYNKLCKQFITDEVELTPAPILMDRKNISYLDRKLEEISWDKCLEGLKNISNRDATLILFWVELYRRHIDDRYDEKGLKYDYTLEHIMPVKWEEHWNFDKVPHPKSELSLEEKKRDRSEKIKWLGNMTLLKSKLNTALSNNTFERKIDGEGRKKGIKHYATLSITKDDIVEPYDRGDKVWDERKIEERTKKLAEEIKQIWG